MKEFTKNQQQAIEAHGDILVVAGAGAGKTGTLVERCVGMLLDAHARVPVSRILVVTFTEAAAAEVRDRIRRELEKTAAADAVNDWVQEQIAGLDAAHICTLHSFCLTLLRENFYALDLDPAVSVLPGEQAEMLFHEVFEELLDEHFAGQHSFSSELQEVIRSHFRGWDRPLRDFIRKLHHYTQTRPAPDRWFTTQMEELGADEPRAWRQWHSDAVKEWCSWWAPYLASLPADNENARFCAKLLREALKTGDMAVVTVVLERRDCWQRGKTEEHRKPFGLFFEEAEFLESVREDAALKQDWEWNCAPLKVILMFARQFSERYREAKRARGAVDFHDLEQGALQLLWDESSGTMTRIAQRWQARLEAVFVDEYQDINAAQDLIISAVSRGADGTAGNRFLVGDIKQSIYAFRQADPSIFRRYLAKAHSENKWRAVFLSDNFRSHEGILRFINPLFTWLMQESVGGVAYDKEAALKFGASDRRSEMALTAGAKFPVELHLLVEDKEAAGDRDEEEDLEKAEREARLVAAQLRALKESGRSIYHQKEKMTRAVEWRDMVVLLRAASHKVEVYAKAFAAMGVPLDTKRDGFFTAPEVLDLCNLLTILDNPLQDIPLVAVLRSPIVGMSANDLATVRANAGRNGGDFWSALHVYLEAKKQNETSRKIESFLERFHQWRNPRQCFSLAQRLEMMLADTGYGEWLLSQPRGRQRHANVQQLLRVARQFDDSRGESLYLFLRHIQELQESAGDIEPAAISELNAVRLMTVHQSKGLEFPVVAVADLGKAFNTTDQNSQMLLHEKYGVCATIKPPGSASRYPSLPLWLAAREQRLSSVGEEMRVLYVALTRAENLLLLFGSTTEKQIEKWADGGEELYPQQLARSRSWLEWIGTHLSAKWPGCFDDDEDASVSVRIHRELPKAEAQERVVRAELSETQRRELLQQLTFEYPYRQASLEPAKTSVSAVRKRMHTDEEAAAPKRFLNLGSRFDGKNRGVAAHTFLQHVHLRGKLDAGGLRAQGEALVARGMIGREELELLDWDGIAAFWRTDVGNEICLRTKDVRRELPFTFQLRNADLAGLGLEGALPVPDGEFVVTQGVADLVLFSENEIWLIDFKTDSVKEDDVPAKVAEYRAQIALYALALTRIYGKPVTRRGLYFVSARRLEWVE